MTTVAIAVNKNNINNLAPYISGGVKKIIGFSESSKFWQVTSLSGNVKNEFIFDKSDFRSSADILGTIVNIVR